MAGVQREVTQLRKNHKRPFLSLPQPEAVNGSDTTRHQRPPPTLLKRLPVNSNKLSFTTNRDAPQSAAKKPKISTNADRKIAYHEFMTLDQAGPATIGSTNNQDCTLVAIKRSNVKVKGPLPSIGGLPSSHVVNLIDIFRKEEEIYMVYEQMDVSLRLINSIPHNAWNAYEIAAVCKEVLNGLTFVHQSGFYYGILDCSTVMLDRDGNIKLGNIGECILEERRLTDSMEREDVRCLGFMMVELMEITTYLVNNRSIELQSPAKWVDKTGIKDFLAATHTMLRQELSKARSPAKHIGDHADGDSTHFYRSSLSART